MSKLIVALLLLFIANSTQQYAIQERAAACTIQRYLMQKGEAQYDVVKSHLSIYGDMVGEPRIMEDLIFAEMKFDDQGDIILALYTDQHFYPSFNNGMRNLHCGYIDPSHFMYYAIPAASVLYQRCNIPQRQPLYRGLIDQDMNQWNRMVLDGEIQQFNTFTSTTTNRSVALGFANMLGRPGNGVLMEISGPPFPLGCETQAVSRFPIEQQVLLRPGQYYQCTSMTQLKPKLFSVVCKMVTKILKNV